MTELDFLLSSLAVCAFVYFVCGRERVEKVRLPNGNQVIVTHKMRSFRVETDWNDPQTLQNMSQELRRINDWWESSRNCKHK